MATLAYRSVNEREYLDPNVVKVVVDGNGQALYFSRAPIPCRRDIEDSPLSFLKHLGFYAYRNDFLQTFTKLPPGRLESIEKLEQLRALENRHTIQVAFSMVETFGVDTPEDLDRISEHFTTT
jgi:3-deoxy-manno-octulosonate cytidylyltransferase (CMP-KDO synthetase)